MKNLLVTVELLIISFQFVGCSTMVAYEGPAQPKEEISVIRTSWVDELVKDTLPNIACIDGKKVPQFNKHIEVLPGKHRIDIAFSHTRYMIIGNVASRYQGYFDFETVAGKIYFARGGMDNGNRPIVWIEDGTTDQVTARGYAVEVTTWGECH